MTTEQIRAEHAHGDMRHAHFYAEGDAHDHRPAKAACIDDDVRRIHGDCMEAGVSARAYTPAEARRRISELLKQDVNMAGTIRVMESARADVQAELAVLRELGR